VVRALGVVLAAAVCVAACGGGGNHRREQAAVASAPTATSTPTPGAVGVTTTGRLGDGTIDDGGSQQVAPGREMNPSDVEPLPSEGVGSAAHCANQTVQPDQTSAARFRTALYCLINAQRRDRGLRTLRSVGTLALAGARHCQNMVRRGYFSHYGPDGPTLDFRVKKAGYRLPKTSPWSLGETLAWGTSTLSTPRAVVNAWLHSPHHRVILLGVRWRELGVGFAMGNPTNRSQGVTVAAEFGFRGS
jgi:uncharacterized protein YkwD